MTELTPPGLDRQRLRNAYSSFATGVTVVATVDQTGRTWGMTASSFYSISLEPPLVSISLIRHTPSRDAFVTTDEFSVSVLNVDQAALARTFARPAPDKFEGVALEPTDFTAPVLADSAAWLVCTPDQVIEVGDHTLLIAAVKAVRMHDRPPLIYHQGTFYGLADQVDEERERLQQRAGTVGFIVDFDDKVALVPDPNDPRGWTLPMGPLAGGRTNADALRATASRLFECPVEPDFLYSVIDVSDHVTCMVYRARLTRAPEAQDRMRWFGVDEIPWDDISPEGIVPLLRRYLTERVADQFGVYVNVGRGRIATISSEYDWDPMLSRFATDAE